MAYASWSLTHHECNYHSTKLELLALKWAIVEQFQKYLLWKPFVVKTDNNPLTYILTTPNLDATQHHWVESLVGFAFNIEYHKGWDNAAADALSQVTSKLDTETVKSSLMESPQEQMFMTQCWLRQMKRYISKSGKLQSRQDPPMCMWTYMWLTGWLVNRKIQYLRLRLSGFPSGKYRVWSIC